MLGQLEEAEKDLSQRKTGLEGDARSKAGMQARLDDANKARETMAQQLADVKKKAADAEASLGELRKASQAKGVAANEEETKLRKAIAEAHTAVEVGKTT